ncbi:MAG: hypothetical protein ACXAD7_09435 [Candidatus Kariarchaeaceae archaeon]|jgi:hypothetical protein
MINNQQSRFMDLFNYWNTIDKVKVLSVEEFDKLNQEIRGAICYVLATGMNDEYPQSGELLKRYALNAKEIKLLVEDELGFEIQKSNLYFHLQKLEESGLIKVVDVIKIVDKQSKRKKPYSFYGRTAKMFLLGGPREKKELALLKHDGFIDLILKLNPEINADTVKNILTQVATISENDFSYFISWMNQYEKELDETNVDFREIFGLVNMLKFHDSAIFDAIVKLANLLKFTKN